MPAGDTLDLITLDALVGVRPLYERLCAAYQSGFWEIRWDTLGVLCADAVAAAQKSNWELRSDKPQDAVTDLSSALAAWVVHRYIRNNYPWRLSWEMWGMPMGWYSLPALLHTLEMVRG